MFTTRESAESKYYFNKILNIYNYSFYDFVCFRTKILGGLSNSVSFRDGSNVEFDGPTFSPPPLNPGKVSFAQCTL